MYFVLVIAMTVALPVLSIAVEVLIRPDSVLLFVFGKWFVFWGIGIRLFVAGLKQVAQPSFTASDIFAIEDPAAGRIVSELGYANLGRGLSGMLSLFWPAWTAPAGLAGGLFLGLAGLRHATKAGRNAKENIAMATDLFVAAMAAVYLVAGALR
jgi:hypothetical protein